MDRKNALSMAALLAALIGTASAEYHLALACGFGPALAACVPAALDIYAIAAFRAKRDIRVAIGALVVTNALSHLLSAGMISASVPLVVAVSAIAPLVLWRVHALQGEGAPVAVQPQEDAVEMQPVADAPPPDAVQSQPVASAPERTPLVDLVQPKPMRDELYEDALRLHEDCMRTKGRPASLRLLQGELKIGQKRAQKLQEAVAGQSTH